VFWPGALNAVNNLVGALYSYAGGWLTERFGIKRSLLLLNLVAIAGYLVVITIPSWKAVIFASLLFLSWSAISLPATMGLISATLPTHKQVIGVSMHSLVRRLPMALGPILGGVFIDHWGPIKGVRIAFGVAIVMASIAVILQQRFIVEKKESAASNPGTANPWMLLKSFSPDLRILFISDVLIRFCEQIPYAYVILWAMRDVRGYRTAHVSATQFGLLTAIEMATAVLIYLPVARLADKGAKKPFVAITFLNFALFPLLLFFSRTFYLLMLAFILRGLKEFGEPTRKTLILQLAPTQQKAASFGAYYLFRDGVVAFAALAGATLWKINPALNLLSAFAIGIVGAIWFCIYGRDSAIAEK
jgi:MFS family permease